MTNVDSYRESTEIDSTQVLESTRLIVTSFLGNCSSCTGICYLGNLLNYTGIGCLGNLRSCTVKRDFCHRSVVLDHDYHVTIQVYPDWILDD